MNPSFRFIHAADLHLDSPFRGLAKAPDAVREALADSTFAAVRRLTDTAIAEKADFIVIAGDLFDEADRSLRAQLALLKEWERLEREGVAVFAIHGNHDHLGGKRAQLTLPRNVHLFGADSVSHKPAFSRNGELAAFVYGLSYGQRAETRNLAASYRLETGAPFHIGLLHANVGGNPAHDAYAPCSIDELAASGFDYWALGHIHKRELLYEYPHIVYPGNIQGRNPRETGAKGCCVIDVSEQKRVEIRFVPLDTVRWAEREVSIEGASTEQELLRRLQRTVATIREEEEGRSIMLRLRLQGRGELYSKINQPLALDALLGELQAGEPLEDAPWVYCYSITSQIGAPIDWEALSAEESFAGVLLRLSQQLERDEEKWQAFAQIALEDVRLHAKLGRIGREKWDKLPAEWLEQAKELTLGLMTASDGRARRE
ncbi:DNA repair exonuclease [Paenibacillus nanensis]|uniref:DNA repair exonuclease n=1 Tax=Paenibacillus nanensis TaxID=393251 RepID=A0A3A1VER4_9BACL|nr:DNA repair exonuclease [Paenibacillus nanensis]RIX59409.1 DNA repair exonuclease [Paenibacillus nanensis]